MNQIINVEACTNLIVNALKSAGIYEVIKQDSSLFVGGSLPSFLISQHLSNKIPEENQRPYNDIDLYTRNYVKTLHNFSKHFGNKIKSIKKTGVNISFVIDNDVPIQIITSEFDDFLSDVLANYDCTLNSAGYYPFKNEFIIHENFISSLQNKEFILHYELSNPKRITKLTERAFLWYNSTIKIVKENENGDFRPYYRKITNINALQEVISPPKYMQLYYNKFTCFNCNILQERLICEDCIYRTEGRIFDLITIRNQKITILGGVNGFGKIMTIVANDFNNDVHITSRNPPKGEKIYKFVLGETVSDELMEHILTSDVVILNAYSTLDNDEAIWLTTLDKFDEKLALDKIKMNTFGYVKLLQEIIEKRKEQIKKENLNKNIKLVFMDANESKYATKLIDSKHLELNMAKAATKQIFYTNANLLASYGFFTISYDVSWLGWHGCSIDLKKSKNDKLIPPHLAALSLLKSLSEMDCDKLLDERKVIFDECTYDVIKKLLK